MFAAAMLLFLVMDAVNPAQIPPTHSSPDQSAQTNDSAIKAPLSEKLQPLAFLFGEWSGDGWTGSPRQRNAFLAHAEAEARFAGRVIVLQALGTATTAKPPAAGPIYETMAMVSWDAQAESYRMLVFRTDGAQVEAKAEVTDKKLVWVIKPDGTRQIRHTITLNDKGQWHEIGELSRDGGENFLPYFELTLNKAPKPATP